MALYCNDLFSQLYFDNQMRHQRLEFRPSPIPEAAFWMCNCTGFLDNVQVHVQVWVQKSTEMCISIFAPIFVCL